MYHNYYLIWTFIILTLSKGSVDPPNIMIVNRTIIRVVVTMYPVTSGLKYSLRFSANANATAPRRPNEYK